MFGFKGKSVLLALLMLNVLNANTCTSKQMGEMIKRGLSSEDIDNICGVKKNTSPQKITVKKEEIKKVEVIEKNEANNKFLSSDDMFIQYENMDLKNSRRTTNFSGFSGGYTKKYKQSLFSLIYTSLSIEDTTDKSETLKIKYAYQFDVTNKVNISPKIIFTNIGGEVDESTGLAVGIQANIEYMKGGYLNVSYILGGMRDIKTANSLLTTIAKDTMPGQLSIEVKRLFLNKIIINAVYKRYKNDTYSEYRRNDTESNIGVGLKYIMQNKVYIKSLYEMISYEQASSDITRLTFRVGYKL